MNLQEVITEPFFSSGPIGRTMDFLSSEVDFSFKYHGVVWWCGGVTLTFHAEKSFFLGFVSCPGLNDFFDTTCLLHFDEL